MSLAPARNRRRPSTVSLSLSLSLGALLALTACGSSSGGNATSTTDAATSTTDAPATTTTDAPATDAPATSATAAPTPATVTLALGWTPNTDYSGVYVAENQGFYKDAGITVKIIPYATTAPETLVSHGKADFGFSYQAGLAYARAAGQDLVSVFAPDQRGTYAIGVRENRKDLASPKDLDGKTYAGFGTPDELPELKYVIKHDGGTGKFKDVTLTTSAYEAVYSGKADFTITVVTWEAIEAQLVGKPLKLFALTDYGFPDQYSNLIASSRTFLDANPDVARRFLAATAKGYNFAADHPHEAAMMVEDENKGVFKNPELVMQSQHALAAGGYLKDKQGRVGHQDPATWSAYGDFLFSNGLLTDANGKKLTAKPDWADYYTNDYLPAEDQ